MLRMYIHRYYFHHTPPTGLRMFEYVRTHPVIFNVILKIICK